MSEICSLTAVDIARHVASRELSCVEVIDAHLRRIDELNPRVNAIVQRLDEEARAAALLADGKVRRGEPLGSLHGVPFTVKTNIDLAGHATSWGVVPLAHAIAPVDAPVVERMRAAGAIAIGRGNMPDMALRIHTDSSLHGLTRNPWHAQRTAGGSSGGEAVAVATGMTALGLGNDIGGSLRNPASACGVASLRPTCGRVPDAGVVPGADRLLAVKLMNVQGPMARRVGDVRAALRVLAGAHPRDPWSVDVPLDIAPGLKRVAMLAEPPGGRTAPEVAAAVRRAGRALAEAGYEVEECCPPRYEEAVAAWAQLLIGDFALVMPQILSLMGEDARRFIENVVQVAPPFADAAAMSALLMRREGIARAWSQFLAEWPLILSPTWTQLPFEHGLDVRSMEGTAAATELMRPVVPANLLGLPSACVPAGIDAPSGLPIGVLLTGARFQDMACLQAAEVVEAMAGVKTPISPVF